MWSRLPVSGHHTRWVKLAVPLLVAATLHASETLQFSTLYQDVGQYIKSVDSALIYGNSVMVETNPSPVEPTQSPVERTQAPVETNQAPVELTLAPIAPTLSAGEPTLAPVKLTQALVEPNLPPFEPTHSSAGPTQAPNEPTQGPEDKLDEYGFPSTDFLPLSNWEKDSIGSNASSRICNPPPGVPRACCVGSISGGGHSWWNDFECLNADFTAAESWTMKYLDGFPIATGRQCDVCEIMELMAQFNWTVAFQGDSVTHQTWEGLVCELARRGFPVMVDDNLTADTPENPGFYRLTLISTMTVTISSSKTVAFRYYRAYRPTTYLLNLTLRENDILVFDHGLHYPVDTYQQQARTDFRNVLEFARDLQDKRVKLLAWRETTAQHFADNPGGYYLLSGTNETKCSRINDNFTASTYPGKSFPEDFWDAVSNSYPRHDYVKTAREMGNITWLDISDSGFQSTPPSQDKQELVFLPYRVYTKELPTLHGRECTHYCANPFIWKPIWRGIRLAMQRTAKYFPLDPEQ